MDLIPVLFIGVAAVALLCEYVDASIGMGYGTTLSPILLIIGFSPLQVVPAVLFGQLAGGLIGGFFHYKLGNVNLDFRRDKAINKRLRGLGYMPNSLDSKVIFILVVCGVVGALIAVFFAINIPSIALTTYIGIMVLGIGLIVLIRKGRESRLSWSGLTAIGLLSSFNKGISGGGYGPLVTGGQIISGREVKSSVGSTTLAEALVCIVAFIGYLLTGEVICWSLAAATGIGSVIAAPFAAHTVKKVNTVKLKFIIGIATTLLGTIILVKTFIF